MPAPEINPAETWVVSDTHFGHRNIVGFCHRPEDHEHVMMEEWAREVPEDATVLHLGDLCYRNNAFFKNMIAPHLTGARKLLIMGNHDKQRFSFYRDCGFKLIKPFGITYGIARPPEGWIAPCDYYPVSFSHYPLRRGDENPRAIHLHGHIHNSGYGGKTTPYTPFSAGQINVSVEQTRYRPVNLKWLLDGYILGCYEPDLSHA